MVRFKISMSAIPKHFRFFIVLQTICVAGLIIGALRVGTMWKPLHSLWWSTFLKVVF